MEVFGIPATAPNIALTLAAVIASLWVGSKVPWKAAVAKLLAMFQPQSTAVTEEAAYDLDDPGDDVMVALRVLHEHAADADSHKLVSAVEADFWQKRKPVEPAK